MSENKQEIMLLKSKQSYQVTNKFDQQKEEDMDLIKISEFFDSKYAPNLVKYRDQELKTIEDFFIKCLGLTNNSKNLLISGQPGCGKTTLFNFFLREIETRCLTQIQFNKLKIIKYSKNAMNFTNTQQLITQVYQDLAQYHQEKLQKNIPIDDIMKKIKEYFINKQEMVILFIDEFDSLFKKSAYQTQLGFKLLELADLRQSRLILIGISNTMDLIYKLSQKYKQDVSRCVNLIFKPYETDQIKKIMIQRLQGYKVFEDNAIDFCIKKIFNLKGGDIRSIMDVLRKSITNKQKFYDDAEDSNTKNFKKIDIKEIQATITQLYNINETQDIIEMLPETQQIALCSIYKLIDKNQEKQFKVKDYFEFHKKISNRLQIPYQDEQNLKEFLMVFDTYKILEFKIVKKKNIQNELVILKIDNEDIRQCLQQNELFKSIF